MIPTAGFSQFSGRVGDAFELVDDLGRRHEHDGC